MGQAQMISPAEHEALITSLRTVRASHLRILVVGCPPGTFADVAEDDSLIFWPSSAPQSHDGTRLVPQKVGAILVTDMLSHALSRNVREQARTRHLICPATTFSAGGARRLLAEVQAEGAPPMPRARVAPFNPVLMPAPQAAQLPPPPQPDPPPPPPPAAGKREVVTLDDLFKLIADCDRAVAEAAAGLDLLRECATALSDEMALVKRQAEKVRMLKELLS